MFTTMSKAPFGHLELTIQTATPQGQLLLVLEARSSARNRRAVDVDAKAGAVAHGAVGVRPCLDHERHLGPRRSATQGDLPPFAAIGRRKVIERSDGAQPFRSNRPSLGSSRQQQVSRLLPAQGVAGLRLEGSRDPARFRAGATIQVGNQVAHGTSTARLKQLEEVVAVVPPRRGLACITSATGSQPNGIVGPKQGFTVARDRLAKGDLDASAHREFGIEYLGGGAAVVLRRQDHVAIAGPDFQPSARRGDGAGDDAQAIAHCTTARQPPQLGRHQRAVDAEQARDVGGCPREAPDRRLGRSTDHRRDRGHRQ